MTHEVPKSKTWPTFEADVAAHAKEMADWRAHMAKVSDPANAKLPKWKQHHPFPRPTAHPLVERSVDEAARANYRIVDDGPTPEQQLAARKDHLEIEVARAAAAAIEAISPRRKQVADALREADVRAADSALRRSMSTPSFLARLAGATVDVEADLRKRRPAADTAFLDQRADELARRQKVERAAALMNSEIEDLTIDTVDGWSMKPF